SATPSIAASSSGASPPSARASWSTTPHATSVSAASAAASTIRRSLAARSAWCTSDVFPMPGGPSTSTTDGSPSRADATRSSSSPSCSVRPTNPSPPTAENYSSDGACAASGGAGERPARTLLAGGEGADPLELPAYLREVVPLDERGGAVHQPLGERAGLPAVPAEEDLGEQQHAARLPAGGAEPGVLLGGAPQVDLGPVELARCHGRDAEVVRHGAVEAGHLRDGGHLSVLGEHQLVELRRRGGVAEPARDVGERGEGGVAERLRRCGRDLRQRGPQQLACLVVPARRGERLGERGPPRGDRRQPGDLLLGDRHQLVEPPPLHPLEVCLAAEREVDVQVAERPAALERLQGELLRAADVAVDEGPRRAVELEVPAVLGQPEAV